MPLGTSLFEAAGLANLDLDTRCGGQGRCGRCRVRIAGGRVLRRSTAGLSPSEIEQGWAVACQTFIQGPSQVEIPERARISRPRGHAADKPQPPAVPANWRGLIWRQYPAVRTACLEIEPPSLGDNTSDLQRVRQELSRRLGISEVRADLALLRHLSGALRAADWTVCVTMEMFEWLSGAYMAPRLIDVRPAGEQRGTCGLAIDVGTTSVVAYLVDFAGAQLLDSAGAYNKQIACGEDVISRIVHARQTGGLERLQRLAIETINDLVAELTQRNHITAGEIYDVVAAGNTTMTHLVLGLDPHYVREEPYVPAASEYPQPLAAEIGLNVNPLARVHFLQTVGSYVGGDTIAGVIATELFAADKLTLLIDIGTNGEMVLGNKDWLLCCACSAGPAFEGVGVSCGMRAEPGAIEDVWIDDASFEPSFRTVDDAPAVGICGSGFIDLLSELLLTGLVDKAGRLNRGAPTPRVRVRGGVPEYVVAWAKEGNLGHDIVITEPDISGLVRAKAAIFAGCSLLCRSVGVQLESVQQLLVAGAFGQYINVEKAIRIGLLPDLPIERFRFVGNTSVLGAYLALLDVSTRRSLDEVAAKMTYLELSTSNAFMDEYTAALFLPHTDLDRFPTVKAGVGRSGDQPPDER